MSVLQAQVIESLNGLSDESLSFLLNMIDKYMKPRSIVSDEMQQNTGGVKIGLFKDERYIADDYDFEQDNDEIAKLFEVIE